MWCTFLRMKRLDLWLGEKMISGQKKGIFSRVEKTPNLSGILDFYEKFLETLAEDIL